MCCRRTKMHGSNSGLYTPLLIPTIPSKDLSMKFTLGLLRIQRGKDSVMVVVDIFSEMVYFVICYKTSDATHVVDLYFK